MDMRFGAKDVPFIRTSGSKNPIQKFNYLPPPYFGGEMGSGYGKMWRKGGIIRISRPMWQKS
jgi:hypothetical protein